jgi:hypothetical protein
MLSRGYASIVVEGLSALRAYNSGKAGRARATKEMTMLEPLTTNNPRVLPQQSISSVTNVDDLETYVGAIEKRTGKSYLSAIDLPVGDRRKVMQDLALMGITAGSLFPGLDGACLQLKERYFDL